VCFLAGLFSLPSQLEYSIKKSMRKGYFKLPSEKTNMQQVFTNTAM